MKKVLIVSQVIPQWYVDTLCNAFGKDVHIDIITGSKIVSANVIPSPPHDARSFKSRIACWIKHLSFMRKWMRENRHKHYDLIFAISNPPINSYIGLALKKQYDAPFVYMNWDLYPQVIEYGINNVISKSICRCWHKWNSCNYPKIDRMLTIGDIMGESMNEGLNRKIPIDVFPIAVDVNRLRPINKKENPFAIQYGLTDKFVVLYSGKMGLGHNIELILEAASLLAGNADIQFVFIGNGPKYAVVERYIADHGAKNILLLPLQTEEMFPYSMACGDVGVVAQEASMAHLFMPSKAYSMMACGEAIIGIGSEHDDLKLLIDEGNIGYNVSVLDKHSLASCILNLYENRQLLDTYKSNARVLAEEKYSIEVLQHSYQQLFNNLDVQ